MKTKSPLEVQVKITIASTESPDHGVFGMGAVTLLEGVKSSGSLNKAAKQLRMAYSKAWTLIRATESNLGFDLIVRDGARGSTLTPEAVELITLYRDIQTKIDDFAQESFSNYFK